MLLTNYVIASVLMLFSSVTVALTIECSTGQDRFTDNQNGTVTDNCTQLIWLKQADCFDKQTWTAAVEKVRQLATGQCGLMDRSTANDWRLPNMKELQSLIDFSQSKPMLPKGSPFKNVQTKDYYWSSTEDVKESTHRWRINFGNGSIFTNIICHPHYVWPVRSK